MKKHRAGGESIQVINEFRVPQLRLQKAARVPQSDWAPSLSEAVCDMCTHKLAGFGTEGLTAGSRGVGWLWHHTLKPARQTRKIDTVLECGSTLFEFD